MSLFTGALTITELEGQRNPNGLPFWKWLWAANTGKRWKIAQDLVYEVGALGSGDVVTVPAGFETDGASVPRCLWFLLPSWDDYSRAAVVHDYLLVQIQKGIPYPFATTRRQADAIFLEAMTVLQVLPIRKYAMYAAVRAWAMFKGQK